MAEAAKKLVKVAFTTAYTEVWLYNGGRKNRQGKVVQPALNAEGLAVLEKYRAAQNDPKIDAFPVAIGFPVPLGGFEQYLPGEVLQAIKDAWGHEVTGRGIKMEFELTDDYIGNARIRINRLRTPDVYKRFCVAFPEGSDSPASATSSAPFFTID